MNGGAWAAFLAWLREVAPFLYDAFLVFVGKEWQRKIDEAAVERANRLALEQQREDVRRAEQDARYVDDHGDDAALERLRDFWRKPPTT